ncbi:ABC transporter permease subunit [Sinorhizobium meliloti]|uniref:ABC transporter permease n=1 Tax=Rhizobium meliloti TaxID=382 RepID=UPI000380B113|nr:ABC transporter permease subunit [Sinorhizobium meliloti]
MHATKRAHRIGGVPAFAFAFVAPTLIIMLGIVAVPLAYSAYLSLNRTNPITGKWIFVGLDNYTNILATYEYWTAFGRTGYFTGLAIVGTTVIGMVMALVLNERFPARGILRSVVLVPWAMAPVSVGVLWSFVLAGDYGALNGLLNDLGLGNWAQPWLGDGFRALNLLALVHIWNQAPLTALLLLSGLQSMPASLHRAAMVDGAGPITRFYSITLPWLKPSLLFIVILATMNALMAFDVLWNLTGGGPGTATTVLAWLGYQYSFKFLRFGEGAAILYMLTAISFVLAIVYFFVFRQKRTRTDATDALEVSHLSAERRHKMVVLPPYHSHPILPRQVTKTIGRAVFAVVAVVIFLWSALPVLSLIIMSLSPAPDLIRVPPSVIPTELTLANFKAVLMPQSAAGMETSILAQRIPMALINSFIVGACVSFIAVVLGTLAGYVFARYSKVRFFNISLWSLLVTRMTPGLTLVLPFFILFRGLGLLDTRTGLIIAHLIVLLPLAAWMMRGYFESVPVSLDHAALIDGCSRLDMMIRVLLPVVKPGLIAAGIFCFLVSWNEFLFAVILTSTPKAQTITVVLSGFLVQARFYEYGSLFAVSVLSIVPPIIVAFIFQRFLIQGALSGSIKG